MKALSSPILGDPLYAAADAAKAEERAYLHASALRIPAGYASLSDDGPIEVTCAPSIGAAFCTPSFGQAWAEWFGALPPGDPWFAGTPVASQFLD